MWYTSCVEKAPYHIKSSVLFSKAIRNTSVEDDQVLISNDMSVLIISVPYKALVIIHYRLEEDLLGMELAHTCTW